MINKADRAQGGHGLIPYQLPFFVEVASLERLGVMRPEMAQFHPKAKWPNFKIVQNNILIARSKKISSRAIFQAKQRHFFFLQHDPPFFPVPHRERSVINGTEERERMAVVVTQQATWPEPPWQILMSELCFFAPCSLVPLLSPLTFLASSRRG